MIIKTDDHPEANGREAQFGEEKFTIYFDDESGERVIVEMGKRSFVTFRNLVLSFDIDEEFEKIPNTSKAS